ncbi:unnamed protein product [Enterobius vermicularis]|uniref:BPTI/Kunitz inhibitor domain-containing protein n=1 Tax=Enterobius vermicularis TaxID=51028 RepID=A0A0N4V0X6_ENTVE|nr:unnamed protein product [Enterobius vermicularis]
MKRLFVVFLFVAIVVVHSCKEDSECECHWPRAFCRNGRCVCPKNTIRRKSDSYNWVCVSLLDAASGMIGSPFSCPLPEGAGHMVAQIQDGQTLCNPRKKDTCPKHYECIITVGAISGQANAGVCCPRREEACRQEPIISSDGWLIRWYFDGNDCKMFNWNPEKNTTTANNFTTKQHCESYCQNNNKQI